jgi:glycerophosphoryl diester phosphodiesterase
VKKSARLVVIAAFILTCSAVAMRVESGPVWVAHRGDNAEADENTLKAYKLAIGYGVNYIECDPRLSKDGIFITMHDPSVERTTTGTGKIADMTLAQIKSLRTRNGEPVPTLEEIFNLAKGAGAGVYLDTKGHDIDYLKQLADFVLKNGMEKKVIVGLWNTSQLKWLHENHPEMESCISWPWPDSSLGKLKKLGASWVGTTVALATKKMIASAHQQGLKVITLQINDPRTIAEKISLGIDAVQTDDPRLMKGK